MFRPTKGLNPKAVSILGVPGFFRDSQNARDVMLFVWLVLNMLLQLSQESLNSARFKVFLGRYMESLQQDCFDCRVITVHSAV